MRKNNQHFELLFFMINLHFGISNQLSKYRKIDLLLISSICLVFSYLELKRNDSQTFKCIATAKNFSPVCMLLVQLAPINYFYSMWQLEENVFYKSLLLPWGSFQPPWSCVVWNKWNNFSLHNTNTTVKV